MVDLGLERDVRTVMIGEAIASIDMIRYEDNLGYLLVRKSLYLLHNFMQLLCLSCFVLFIGL